MRCYLQMALQQYHNVIMTKNITRDWCVHSEYLITQGGGRRGKNHDGW